MLHYILFIKYFILNITKTLTLKIHILLIFCSNEMVDILLVDIGGYYIVSHWWLLIVIILVAINVIILMAIGGY